MKITELLTEETLDLNTFKVRNPNYWTNLISRISSGQPVTIRTGTGSAGLHDVIIPKKYAAQLKSIWNPGNDLNNVATPEQVFNMKRFIIAIPGGETIRLNQIEKTKDIKQKISANGEVAGNSKWWNKGNVAEGVMSCAVITKFENKGADINADQVMKTIQKVQGGIYNTITLGKKLSLKIVLSVNDYKALIMSAQDETEFRKFDKSEEIYKLYEDCAAYVNQSDNVQGALEKIKMAAKGDTVEVTADGATPEAQSSTKADLWIALGGKKERLLSIKTSTVKHIGAVSGYEAKHIDAYFKSTVGIGLPENILAKFKNPPAPTFIVDPTGNKIANPNYRKMGKEERSAAIKQVMDYNYKGPLKDAYKYIYKEINDRLSGKSATKDYDFIKTVTDGVLHHATLGEDIRIVIISPSAKKSYTELKFGPELLEALKQYDLVPVLNMEGANYKLLVYGFPIGDKSKRVNNDKSLFVQMRSYIQDSAARNVVEIGGLLKDLTNVEKLENSSKNNQQQQPSNVPATPVTNTKSFGSFRKAPTPAGVQNMQKAPGAPKIPMGQQPR